MILNGQTLTLPQLRDKLKQLSDIYPDQAIYLRGDEKVDYKHIVDVLDTCREANIWNVAFAAARPAASSAQP